MNKVSFVVLVMSMSAASFMSCGRDHALTLSGASSMSSGEDDALTRNKALYLRVIERVQSGDIKTEKEVGIHRPPYTLVYLLQPTFRRTCERQVNMEKYM